MRQRLDADVVVYAGTPGGIVASITAARRGARVLLLEQTLHLGGLNTSGLNTSEREHMLDVSFGGIQLEVYQRLGRAYGHDQPASRWESRVLERVFVEMLDEAGVAVRFESLVDAAEVSGGRLRAMTLVDGTRIAGRVFIDASYEGDLMHRAGVTCTFGRESVSQYGESLAGIRFIDRPEQVAEYDPNQRSTDEHIRVSPYDDEGRLLAGVEPAAGLVPGEGDRRVMNYNFRVTVSSAPDRVPIQPPPRYNPARFELLARYLALQPETPLSNILDFYPWPSGKYVSDGGGRLTPQPTHKWELNNRQNAVISLGHFGGQFDYPDADHARRRAIWEDHREHNQGLLYFLGHDERVPAPLRREMLKWGLAADEYADHDHWPYQLYIREARRMVGQYVMTQRDILEQRDKPDAIHLGSHWIDCHHVQRIAVDHHHFRNEGRIWVRVDQPFAVPYRAVTPKPEQCDNLLVPVCVSASHVAFCPIRLESTWMALGHAAGEAAAFALEGDVAVQMIDVDALRQNLRRAKLAVDL